MTGSSPTQQPLLIHATTVALGTRAVLIRGPSGSGKSDLALRFLSAQGALPDEQQSRCLVADDQTDLSRDGNHLIARCPPSIAGRIEVRGIGIVEIRETRPEATVVAVVDLVDQPAQVPRMPLARVTETYLGLTIPLFTLCPFEASAPLKVALILAATP